jgi:hypothetical protein
MVKMILYNVHNFEIMILKVSVTCKALIQLSMCTQNLKLVFSLFEFKV